MTDNLIDLAKVQKLRELGYSLRTALGNTVLSERGTQLFLKFDEAAKTFNKQDIGKDYQDWLAAFKTLSGVVASAQRHSQVAYDPAEAKLFRDMTNDFLSILQELKTALARKSP